MKKIWFKFWMMRISCLKISILFLFRKLIIRLNKIKNPKAKLFKKLKSSPNQNIILIRKTMNVTKIRMIQNLYFKSSKFNKIKWKIAIKTLTLEMQIKIQILKIIKILRTKILIFNLSIHKTIFSKNFVN